jgi:urease accessory protein
VLVVVPPSLERAYGACELILSGRTGTTRLAHLYQHDPYRILFPRVDPGELTTAVVTNTAGGMVGGDRLRVDIRIEDGGRAIVVGQSAEKVYRSLGPATELDVTLAVEGGWLEYLPQETILFEGSRLRRQTRLDVAGGGRALAGEILVFGRVARGETLTYGLVRDAWTVRRDGRLVWADALQMESDDIARCLGAPAGFSGARASAMAVYVGPDATERLDEARALAAGKDVRSGATLCGPVLVVRWMGADPLAVRRAFGDFWQGMRAAAAQLPARLPRLWHV